MQSWPTGHATPQASQLLGSLEMSTQVSEQQRPVLFDASGQGTPEFPGPQVGTGLHWPDRQNDPVEQTVPQRPQLASSTNVSTQAEPQQWAVPPALPGPPHGSIASLALQVWVAQKPETQAAPDGHTLPEKSHCP